MEAEATPDTVISEFEKAIAEGKMSHEVITDSSAKSAATKTIETNGYEGALEQWNSIVNGRGKATKNDIALGQMLYNQAVNAGDVQLAMKLAAELAMEATRAGQTVQAFRLLKQMTPDGRLYALEKVVQKINQELLDRLGSKFTNVTIDENLARELLNSQTQEETNAAVERIQQNIADQIPPSWVDKWNAWRYLAMLGNPRTHIRNILGNAIFVPVRKLKNIIGAGLEKTLPKSERTKSFITNKANREFAKADFEANSETIRGENKYDISAGIDEKRTIFKNKVLEGARRLNFAGLEKVDLCQYFGHKKLNIFSLHDINT